MFSVHDLLRLSSVPRIGPLKMRALVSHFKDPGKVFEASPRELIHVPGIDKKLASMIVHHTDGEAFATSQLKRINKLGARVVTIWEKEYPELLKRIYDPPALIFVLGTLEKEDNCSIALVGTRHPTPYGERVAETFSRELSQLGIPTVSGLARGIDTIVHATTLKAGGRTVAVIGSGLDVPYPPENKKLMDRIAEEGAVISEFPMGTKPDAPNFPRRNRIISGLSLGTVIIESAEDGGAMITASTALDQDREVFAVPGNILERRSKGPNRLIREGRAKLVGSIEEVLEELQLPLKGVLKKQVTQEQQLSLSLFEQSILDLLSDSPLHIDTIAEQASMSTSDALVTLLSLEFKGIVKQLPGKMFVRL